MSHHQIGEIRADDEQHESDGGLQNPDRARCVPNNRVLQRPQLKDVVCRAQGTIRRDMVLGADTPAPVIEERVQLRLGRLRRDAVFQPRNDVEDVGAALASRIRVDPKRQPDLGAVVHDVGAGQHDAENLVGSALDFHGLSNHRLSPKGGVPQLVRENRDRWRQRPTPTGGFLFAEEASQRANVRHPLAAHSCGIQPR